MPLLTPQQIQQWDAYTIAHEPIFSIDLMERAAQCCTDFFIEKNLTSHTIKIFCAKGNNGGDGLAIARQLIESGFSPIIYILEFGALGTEDFQTNLNRLHLLSKEIYFVQSKEFFPAIDKNDLLVDALFGSGLNRPLENLSAELVTHLNDSLAPIISIDVPSGLFIDKSSKGNTIVKATHTLSLQSNKLCFLVAENAHFFGEVHLLDIGLHPKFLERIDATNHLISKKQIRNYIKPRPKFSHKGSFGHVLLVAGSKGKMGAAVLAAKAGLRSGAGLLSVNIPENGLNIIQTAVPEAMCMTRDEPIELNKYASIGIGPGIGKEMESLNILQTLLLHYHRPMVIDADALNLISENKEWMELIPAGSIITPHPIEFERLFGKVENDFERIELAINQSKKYPIIIILKGHFTLIAENGKGWFNTTGNAAMATGGSGDVLTGIISALLAQGYSPFQAATCGVYLHGYAGDMAVNIHSSQTLIASDITKYIGQSLYEIYHDEPVADQLNF